MPSGDTSGDYSSDVEFEQEAQTLQGHSQRRSAWGDKQWRICTRIAAIGCALSVAALWLVGVTTLLGQWDRGAPLPWRENMAAPVSEPPQPLLRDVYILSMRPDKFNWTRDNMERAFPQFFRFHLLQPLPVTDARVLALPSAPAKLRSQMLTIFDMWQEMAHGSAYAHLPDDTWMFLLEDDVDVQPLRGDEQPNYSLALQQLLAHPPAVETGWMYLGLCCASDCGASANVPAFSHAGYADLYSVRGSGMCNHGMGFTRRQAALMVHQLMVWDVGFDQNNFDGRMLRLAEKFPPEQRPFIFGATREWPANSGHRGIVFQDRVTWPPNTEWGNTQQ